DQGLAVDVEAARGTGSQAQCCQRQHTRAAAEVDDLAPLRRMRIEPLEAQCGGWVSARAKGQPGIQSYDRGGGIRDSLVVRADPESHSEPHRVKVTQPLPLPGAIGYLPRLQQGLVEPEGAAQRADGGAGLSIGSEERPDAR